MSSLSKWQAAVYLAAIFLAGGVSGWMAATTVARQAALKRPQPREIAKTFKERTRALHLTPEQQAKVDAIADRAAADVSAVNEENVRRIKSCFSNRHAQVCALLTPEQREQFERTEKERRHRWNGKGRRGSSETNRWKE